MISCVVGVGEAEGDAAGGVGLPAIAFVVGAEDGAGLWANKVVANKNEMTVVAARFNICVYC